MSVDITHNRSSRKFETEIQVPPGNLRPRMTYLSEKVGVVDKALDIVNKHSNCRQKCYI